MKRKKSVGMIDTSTSVATTIPNNKNDSNDISTNKDHTSEIADLFFSKFNIYIYI